jgi:hypothetical protein
LHRARLDGGRDVLVRLLHALALEVRRRVREAPVGVGGVERLLARGEHAGGEADAEIILAERGRLVHDAGAAVVRDVRIGHHGEGAGARGGHRVVKQRHIAQAWRKRERKGDSGVNVSVALCV